MKLNYFKEIKFLPAIKALLKELNVPVNYITDEPASAKEILEYTYKDNETFQLIEDVYFVGMVDDAAFEGNESFDHKKIKSDYDGILFFGVELKNRGNNLLPTRTQLADIARAFNREFHFTPVVVVFKYANEDESFISFANTERIKYKQEWREGEKAGKVSMLRDISIEKPHRGHEDIINALRITTSGKKAIRSFDALYKYWQEVFSVNILNKKFYQELSNWYFWAIKNVTFPSEPTLDDVIKKYGQPDHDKLAELINEHNATNVIRLLTRLLFTWFIKEKKLIPESLFDLDSLQNEILKDINPYQQEGMFKHASTDSIYYKAILQNLFFASLNCPIEADAVDKRKRGFRGDGYGTHRGIDYLMRYKKQFKNPDAFLDLMNQTVPFLNGGLFECLDDKYQNIYIDGFSDQMTKGQQLIVPDYLFFGLDTEVDLSQDYGSKNKKYKKAAVKGLINILKSYKFTITENTPIEEEVALDPELLGKVFENLLASYNPETKSTARKQTGSFYTPREIVNYMVDESLIAYLKNAIDDWGIDKKVVDTKLHQLTSFDPVNPFEDNTQLSQLIIKNLDQCKILDPACGSGAFPMGILQKMVHILQKLDPSNEHWKEVQLGKAIQASKEAYDIEDKQERENKLIEINDAFDNNINDPDYARKLYLIENCIYGVDIQPIATQISKLRFFISLVVDQKKNDKADNFGIRALPNLETKFVTANTLIGIEKPPAQASLYDTDSIKELERDLKSIRHKLFGARSKDTKLKYRKKDEKLRNAISEELKKSGWHNETADKLASWDPYDQNASASYFDPEWMFDVKSGFDIIIGNPPYASAVTMARSESIKKKYKKLFPLATGAYDIFILFLYKTISLLNDSGFYTWIIPNKFLIADYAKKTREYLINNGLNYSIDVSTFNVFENASVYPIIILGNKYNSDTNFQEYLLEQYTDLEKRIYKLPVKLKKHSLIKDFNLKLASGATGFEAKKIKTILSDIQVNNSIPFTVSGCIDRYMVKNLNVRFMGLKLESAYVKKSNIIADSKWRMWSKPKIIVAGMTKEIEAVYSETPFGLGVGVYCIYEWGDYNPYYITAILNSSYLTYYLRIKFKDKHLAGGYLAINKSTLEKLPFVKKRNEQSIEFISRLLHFDNSSTESKRVKTILDFAILELFFEEHIKELEIDVLKSIDHDVKEFCDNRNNMSQQDAESIIRNLAAKWTHPDNVVRNRTKLFAVRSPEILKPILER